MITGSDFVIKCPIGDTIDRCWAKKIPINNFSLFLNNLLNPSFFFSGFVIAFSLCLLILGVLVTFGFTAIVNRVIDSQVALKQGGQSYGWWSKPPVEPKIRVYVYNVTNADEFLNNGSKPILEELGPYVYK